MLSDMPTTYDECRELMRKLCGENWMGQSKEFANNTRIEHSPFSNNFYIVHWNTIILTLEKEGIHVTPEGYHTVTTFNRINRAIRNHGYSLGMVKSKPMLYSRHEDKAIPFRGSTFVPYSKEKV